MEINWPSIPEIAQRWDALYQYLSRLYQLETVAVTLADHQFELFKVKNIDQLLDQAAEQIIPSPDDIPYWSELWPSALALAQYLLREVDFSGQVVVELGCGLGLAGLAAGKKGGEVIFTDLKEDALRLAELNWLHNLHTPVVTRILDWRNPPTGLKVPILIAADVAYEKRLFAPLLHTIDQLLIPEGILFLSEPNRSVAREFFQQLQAAGFNTICHSEPVPGPGGEVKVSVYRVERR